MDALCLLGNLNPDFLPTSRLGLQFVKIPTWLTLLLINKLNQRFGILARPSRFVVGAITDLLFLCMFAKTLFAATNSDLILFSTDFLPHIAITDYELFSSRSRTQ